jgi:catechol 2,3-dioxygenase-like lactoylglutathione lyase family enzyme
METSSAIHNEPPRAASAAKVAMKFEVVVIPVGDVDRAKAFYTRLGWRLDADFSFDHGFRVVQFTPPGSGCSVQFGTKITTAEPGSAQGLYLIVPEVEAARKELAARDVEVSEVFHTSKPGAQFRPESEGRASGPHPDHRSYFSFSGVHLLDAYTQIHSSVVVFVFLPDVDRNACRQHSVDARNHDSGRMVGKLDSEAENPTRASRSSGLRVIRPGAVDICRPMMVR